MKDEEKDAVKANVLKLLQDQYGMEEEDFIAAELEIVPGRCGKRTRCRQKHDHVLWTR